MPENGDDKSLFENFSFEDDLIIEGAEVTNTQENEQTLTEESTTKGTIENDDNPITNQADKKEDVATTEDDQMIEFNFNDPSAANEPDSDDLSDSSDTDSDSSSSSPISLVAAALSAEGFFELEDGELDNVEDPAAFLREKLNKVIDEKAKSNLSDKKLEALDAFEKGVPIQEYVNSNAKEQQYSQITNEQIQQNEQWQAELVARSLKARGFSDEEIKEEINIYREVGGDKLAQKGIAAKEHLIQVEQKHRETMLAEAEQKKAEQEENRKQGLNKLKEYVTSQDQIIENLPLTDKVKEDVYKIMTTPVAEDRDGNPINAVGVAREKDPDRFNMLMTYYYNMGLFDEKPDISKLKKIAETKTASALDNLLGEGTSFLKTGGSKNAKPKSKNNLGLDFID